MKSYTVFNENKIIKTLLCSEETLTLNVGEDESYIEGNFSDELYYVKNNEIKEYPKKPEYPVNFNINTEEWVWDETVSWGALRDIRNTLLSENVDSVVSNPLRWASMTTEKQTEYTTYRQALLDLPQNTEDPRSPNLPTPPE
jgi:hypothetical protein